MGQKRQYLNKHWSCCFQHGDPVYYSVFQQREAHVVAAFLDEIPPGHVPIMFDDEEFNDEENGFCITVPADDLDFQ